MKRLLLALLVSASGLTGCLQPTDTEAVSISLAGRWQYSAREGAVSGRTLTGSMLISEPSAGRGFVGSIEATSTGSDGDIRSLAANLSGAATNSDNVDFDVYFESVPRRHVGRLEGDVLSGTWLRLSDAGIAESGTFTARRVAQ